MDENNKSDYYRINNTSLRHGNGLNINIKTRGVTTDVGGVR